jgi:hypothetical protein
MNRIPVKSSLLKSVGYDPETKQLEVEFAKTGRLYAYQDVPADVHATVMGAESVGAAFLKHVRNGGYAYTATEPEAGAPQAAAGQAATAATAAQ